MFCQCLRGTGLVCSGVYVVCSVFVVCSGCWSGMLCFSLYVCVVLWCVFILFAVCYRCVFRDILRTCVNIQNKRDNTDATHNTRSNAHFPYTTRHTTQDNIFTRPTQQRRQSKPHPPTYAHTKYTTYNNAHTQQCTHMKTTTNNKHPKHIYNPQQTSCNTHQGIPRAHPFVWILAHAVVAHEAAPCSDAARAFGADDRGAQEQSLRGLVLPCMFRYLFLEPRCMYCVIECTSACKSFPSMVRWVVGGSWQIGSSSLRSTMRPEIVTPLMGQTFSGRRVTGVWVTWLERRALGHGTL